MNLKAFIFLSDRTRIRTWDRLLRRQVLYPAELCDLKLKSGANILILRNITTQSSLKILNIF